MAWIIFLVAVCFLESCLSDSKDLFSSTFQMTEISLAEIEFVKSLKLYAESDQIHSKLSKEFLEDVYRDFNPASNPEEHVLHPMNSLAILRRLGHEYFYHKLRETIELNHKMSPDLGHLKNITEVFPDVMDYAQACSSICLLQEAYRLSAEDLAVGNVRVRDKTTGNYVVFEGQFTMSWYEMFQLGTMACNRGWLDTGISWFEMANSSRPLNLSSVENQEKSKEMDTEFKLALQIHDHILEKRGPISVKYRTFPVPFDSKLRKKKKYKNKTREFIEKPPGHLDVNPAVAEINRNQENFYYLCKDGQIKQTVSGSDYSCRFQHHNNPYLKLGPFKIEEVNESPFIVVFHDILNEKEMSILKRNASRDLMRSRIGNVSKLGKTDLKRTSKQNWLLDRYFITPKYPGSDEMDFFSLATSLDYYPELPSMGFEPIMSFFDETVFKLSQKVERATGLNVMAPYASEIYQVANYGIGGQYDLHFDPSGGMTYDKSLQSMSGFDRIYGERLATFMGYLENLPFGGATAFPMVGKAIQPEKGSAVFWINLTPSLDLDRLTTHGGCPVLIGSKWITNKWIGALGQFDKLKCGIKPLDKFHLLKDWRKNHI